MIGRIKQKAGCAPCAARLFLGGELRLMKNQTENSMRFLIISSPKKNQNLKKRNLGNGILDKK